MNRFALADIAFRHTVPVQLRFNDTDALGHINNNAYFAFYDIGKTSYFDAVNGRHLPPSDIRWVVAHAEINFIKPVFLSDEISVQTAVCRIGHKSFELVQQIVDKAGTVRSEYRSIMVGFDFVRGVTVPISHEWRNKFALFEGRTF